MHPTAARVKQRLHERGLDVDVQVVPDSTRTAGEAAAAVGCEVGQIVKSLRRFATVWCAAGTPHAVFEADTESLIEAIPGGAVVDVS